MKVRGEFMTTKSVFFMIAVFLIICGYGCTGKSNESTVKDIAGEMLPGPENKIKINEDMYFVYKFDKKPALGNAVLKIEVFNSKNLKVTDLIITGDSGMPSMGSAHDSGAIKFSLNKYGNYLLPLNIVMPGEWVVKLQFVRDNITIFRGKIRFNV